MPSLYNLTAGIKQNKKLLKCEKYTLELKIKPPARQLYILIQGRSYKINC